MRRMVVDPSSSGQERSVLLLHPHWKVLLGPVVFGVLIVVAAIMVVVIIPAGSSAGTARLTTVAVAIVLLLIGVVRPFLRWKTKQGFAIHDAMLPPDHAAPQLTVAQANGMTAHVLRSGHDQRFAR